MIFDKYIALIIESIERHTSLILASTKEDNKILQAEIGALGRELKDRDALHEKVLELERENRLLEEATEGVQEEFISVSEKLEKVLKDWGEAGEEHLKKEACSEAEIERQSAFIKNAEKMLETAEKAQDELKRTIAGLEANASLLRIDIKDATERNVEAQAKQERLLTLAKEYDKATVSMLNAILERRSSIEERATWEAAKEALKGWDKPEVKRKGRPKKQS